eukprot:TCONS_00028479-protein
MSADRWNPRENGRVVNTTNVPQRNFNNYKNRLQERALQRKETQRPQEGESKEICLEKEVKSLKEKVKRLEMKVEKLEASVATVAETATEGKSGQTFVSPHYPLIWGAEKYFIGKKTGKELYPSYTEWYKDIHRVMRYPQYITKDFLFVSFGHAGNETNSGFPSNFTFRFVPPQDIPHHPRNNSSDIQLAHLLKPHSTLLALHPTKLDYCFEF